MRNRGDILERFLTTIENAVIAYARHPNRSSRSAHQMFREFNRLQRISKRQMQDVLAYSRKCGYVQVHIGENGHRTLVLSASGRAYIDKRKILNLKIPKQDHWDRKWRLVMFDIPEPLKKRRNGFAMALKRMGMLAIQKSVFVYPYPCENEIKLLIQHFEIVRHVDMVVGEHLSRAKYFEKQFNVHK